MARKSNVAARRAAIRRDQEAFYGTRARRALRRTSNKSISFPTDDRPPLIGPGAKRAFRPRQGSGRYR